MRRKDREITDFAEILKIISNCDILRLGLPDGDYPYIVPVNFGYQISGGTVKFYIHGACSGRKYELLKKLGRCSFEADCVYELIPKPEEGAATVYYESVMGTADVRFLDGKEKVMALERILIRYRETFGIIPNPKLLEKTMAAELTVREITAKSNPGKTAKENGK